MADIPQQLTFEHMLSHVFPGFFTAITVFMALDIWSPLPLVQYLTSDNFSILIGFAAYVLICGTILGVIIDGIHHKVIEEMFLEKYPRDIEIRDIEDWLGCEDKKMERESKCNEDAKKKPKSKCEICRFLLNLDYEPVKIYYLFHTKSMENYLGLYEYVNKRYYHYYEFFANTSIALIPFAFVAPIYINQELQIDHFNSLLSGSIIMIMAFSCFWICITAYSRYISALYFIATWCRENKDDCDQFQFIHPIIVE